MDIFSYAFVFLILVLLAVSYVKDRKATGKAIKIGQKSLSNVASMFLAMFLLVGLFEIFLPASVIERLMGKGAGSLAPFMGTVLGGIATGPPAVIFPIAKSLLLKSAGYGAIAALMTAWVSVGTVTLPAESEIMGRRFAVSRWSLTLVFSVIIGLGTGLLMGMV